MANTTKLNLEKLSGTSKLKNYPTPYNNNLDLIDAFAASAVTGPSSSTDSHVAVFDGTEGKTIKDSGYTIASSVPSNAAFTDTWRPIEGNVASPASNAAYSSIAGNILNDNISSLSDQIANLIKTENKTISNLSIPAGESSSTLNVAVNGYTFRGLIGYAFYGANKCVLSRAIIESNNVLTYSIYNDSGSAQTASSAIFRCLYTKS